MLGALLLLCLAAACGEETPAPDPARLREEAAPLVARLGDDDFQKREEATKRLRDLGEPVLPFLAESLKKAEDPEIRMRLEELLASIPLDAGFAAIRNILPKRVASAEDLGKLRVGDALARILKTEKGDRLLAQATALLALESLFQGDWDTLEKLLGESVVAEGSGPLRAVPKPEFRKLMDDMHQEYGRFRFGPPVVEEFPRKGASGEAIRVNVLEEEEEESFTVYVHRVDKAWKVFGFCNAENCEEIEAKLLAPAKPAP